MRVGSIAEPLIGWLIRSGLVPTACYCTPKANRRQAIDPAGPIVTGQGNYSATTGSARQIKLLPHIVVSFGSLRYNQRSDHSL
jgi:hypothetical protein